MACLKRYQSLIHARVILKRTPTGIKKKLGRISNTSECDIVGKWIKSITNHLYWCAASAPDGDGDDMMKRWKSLIDHVCDIHEDCYHSELSDRPVKYFSPGT